MHKMIEMRDSSKYCLKQQASYVLFGISLLKNFYQNRGVGMKIRIARDVPKEKMNQFFSTTDQVNKDSLLKEGYVVEFAGEIKGCFELASVEDGVFWLKQLYIAQEEAQKLPVLLETIIVLAKSKEAKKVYVFSHQPVVDILLGSLQFHPQKEALNVQPMKNKQGNWWAYEVS